MKVLALVALFALLLLLRLGSIHLVDYDEGCFATVSKAMVLRGDYLNPTLNGVDFYEKPPMLYWSQVLGYRLLGINPWGARFFNALAAIAALASLYLFARRPLGEDAAFLGSFVLGSSLLFVALGRVAITDMLLTLWFILCLGSLHRGIEGRGDRWFLASALAAALAILTKGAIGLLFPGAAALLCLLYRRKLGSVLRISWMIPAALIAVLVGFSWYLLLGFTHEKGFAFMRQLFLQHHVGRFSEPMQGHSGPFVYYIPVLMVGFMPWAFFLAHAAGGSRRAEGESARFLGLFGAFSAIVFVFFSVAATKLPNYITPALPGFALLVGYILTRPGEATRGWRVAFSLAAVVYAILAAVLLAAPAVVAHLPAILGDKALKAPGLATPPALGIGPYIGALFAAGGVYVLVAAARRGPVRSVAWPLVICNIGLAVALTQFILPRYDAHFVRPLVNLAVHAAGITAEDERIVLVSLRHRPSVSFFGGRNTVYCSAQDAARVAELFAVGQQRIGITTEHYFGQLEARSRFQVLARDGGYVLFSSDPAIAPGAADPTAIAR